MTRIPAILAHPIYFTSGRLAADKGPAWLEVGYSGTVYVYSGPEVKPGISGALLYTFNPEHHPELYIVITPDRLTDPRDVFPSLKSFRLALEKAHLALEACR